MFVRLNRYSKSPIVLIIGLFFITQTGVSQHQSKLFERVDSLSNSRFAGMMATAVSGSAITIGLLSKEWYSEYEKVPFHFFNDNDEWLQMDKIGHGVTAFYGGVYGYNALKWTGLSEWKSIWLGGTYGFTFLLATEIMDGHSSAWGASGGDLFSNGLGTGLFISQQLIFHRQIITPKFSYWPSDFAQYRPSVLGDSHGNRWLKDYNGQVYWLSFSPLKRKKNGRVMNHWLALAFGYSGNGMLGGSKNPRFNSSGEELPEFDREREFYLSLDLNFQNIKTKNAFVNMILKGVSFVKIPAPAIKLRGGKLGFSPLQ